MHVLYISTTCSCKPFRSRYEPRAIFIDVVTVFFAQGGIKQSTVPIIPLSPNFLQRISGKIALFSQRYIIAYQRKAQDRSAKQEFPLLLFLPPDNVFRLPATLNIPVYAKVPDNRFHNQCRFGLTSGLIHYASPHAVHIGYIYVYSGPHSLRPNLQRRHLPEVALFAWQQDPFP